MDFKDVFYMNDDVIILIGETEYKSKIININNNKVNILSPIKRLEGLKVLNHSYVVVFKLEGNGILKVKTKLLGINTVANVIFLECDGTSKVINENRRKYYRVKYEVDIELLVEKENIQKVKGKTIDISENGIKFTSKYKFNKKDCIRAEIFLYTFNNIVINIAYIRKDNIGNYIYGAEVNGFKKKEIISLIFQQQRNELSQRKQLLEKVLY